LCFSRRYIGTIADILTKVGHFSQLKIISWPIILADSYYHAGLRTPQHGLGCRSGDYVKVSGERAFFSLRVIK
jgi:hypothetical protein